uniref:ubiquitinyl hydrolase 1 n=1 Tax=Rhizophora mucronata TaxID=61149 RepID=A0A2P2NFB9_RHIMU
MDSEKTPIYHERQKLQFCLLHALNNLFQRKDAFTRSSLDAIAEKLMLDDPDPNKRSWAPFSLVFKPHHNSFTGNYDINVLMAALEEKGKTVIWHDRRNGASGIDLDGNGGPDDDEEEEEKQELFGIVLNVPVKRYAGLWKSRHWISMRKIDGVWYNLDSDLAKPMAFEDCEDVRQFLDYLMGHGGEVLLILNSKD